MTTQYDKERGRATIEAINNDPQILAINEAIRSLLKRATERKFLSANGELTNLGYEDHIQNRIDAYSEVKEDLIASIIAYYAEL